MVAFLQDATSTRAAVMANPAQRRAVTTHVVADQRLTSTSSQHGNNYFANDTRPVVLFDGVCNLCNTGVNFMLKFDTQARFRLAALQSHAGQELLQRAGRRPDDISSIVLVDQNGAYIKSEAALRISRGLGMPVALLAYFGLPWPLLIRDAVYDAVANNRYRIAGKRNMCRMMEPGHRERFLME